MFCSVLQSSTTPDPGYQWESDRVTTRHHRSAIFQQVTTRHQQTDVHESITKQDRNNKNDPQKMHRLGTVSKHAREPLYLKSAVIEWWSQSTSGKKAC